MPYMIRIKPYEWLHMSIPGSGRLGRTKIAGTLYITPHRVVIQGAAGPVWSAPIQTLNVKTGGKIEAGKHNIEWKSKIPAAWWGNTILFWKEGVVTKHAKVDGPPPAFREIAELPGIMRQTKWNFRWYDRETLAEYGIAGKIPDDDTFDRLARHTNIILAALRHDGFPNGPPPAYYRMMLQRHALTHATHLVWGWLEAQRHMRDVISGRGRLPRAYVDRRLIMDWPDRWYEPKPFDETQREWHHELNPAGCGGTSYQILEKCRTMIPLMGKVADELHENPTYNPYLRLRHVYEAVRDGRDIPPPPREALPLARRATDNPW